METRRVARSIRLKSVKTKMISDKNAGKVSIEEKIPCAVCRNGVGSNSILSQFCRCWVHKISSYIRTTLKDQSKFKF